MNTTEETAGQPVTNAQRNYVFILLFILMLCDQADRMVITSLFPYIQKDWGISDLECGLLVSMFYWAAVVCVFPASILVDRWSRKKSIGILSIIWSVASFAGAFTTSFRQLLTTRTVIGVGEAGYGPAGAAMLSWLYPLERRARVFGIWNAAQPLGMAVGVALGGIIAVHLGWRHAFGIVAIPGLIAAILFFFAKDYKSVPLQKTVAGSAGEASTKAKMKTGDVAKVFLGNPTVILTYLGLAGVIFVVTAISTWLPSYFHRIGGMAQDEASLRASLVLVLSMVGFFIGGFFSDIWVKKKLNSRPIFAAMTTLVSGLLVFIAFSLTGLAQYCVLIVMGILITAFAPAGLATIQEVVHPGLRGMSYALAVLCMNLLGGSLGPIVVGSISDASNLQTAMMTLPRFLVLAAAFFFAASFFYVRDFNKVEKVTLEVES